MGRLVGALGARACLGQRYPRRSTTLAGFTTLGLFWGAWASVLPSVQDATDLSKGALGVALLFVSVGSIPAMFFVAGPLVARLGARAVAYAAAAFAAATTLPGLDPLLPHARARPRSRRRHLGDPRRRGERERGADRAGHRTAPDAARPRALLRRHPHRRGGRGRRARRRRGTRADPARCLGLPRADSCRGSRRHRSGRNHELTRHAAHASPDRDRPARHGRVRGRGRNRELERALPRACARREPVGQRPRPGRVRRVDGSRAVLRPGGRPHRRPGACSSAAPSSARPAASWPRSAPTQSSGSSGSRSAAPGFRSTRRSSSGSRAGGRTPRPRSQPSRRSATSASSPAPPLVGLIAQVSSLRVSFIVLAAIAAAVAAASTRLRID